jgi:hypothetical protein
MLLGLGSIFCLSLGGAGLACPQAKVKVTLVVILATEEGNTVDKRLKNIAEEIQKLNPNLKSFHLRTMTDHSLTPGEKTDLPLVEKQKAVVLVKHGADKDNKVSLAITPPGQDEIVYSTVCGKFLPIVTRYHTKKKERLILAVRVQPCKED